MLELSFRNSRGSAGSVESRYTFSDSSMIDLVRGLNGATFDPFNGDPEHHGFDSDSDDDAVEGLVPMPTQIPPSESQRRRLSTNVAGIRSRISQQNLVGFFGGSQRGRDDESKSRGESRRHILSLRGRPTSVGTKDKKAPESPPSSAKDRKGAFENNENIGAGENMDPAESTDTLQVAGDVKVQTQPETIEVSTLNDEKPRQRKPTRKAPTDKIPESLGDQAEKEKAEAANKKSQEVKSQDVSQFQGKEKVQKKEKKISDADTPTDKLKSRHAALSSLDPHKNGVSDCPLVPTKTELEGKSKEGHTGTTWMRKSASSLFPSLTRDGANTLPPFQRWSNLLGSHSSHINDDSSVFLPRASADCNTISGAQLLQHDGIEPRTSSPDCTEHGKRMYWRKLIQGRFSWSRKSSKVKEEPISNSAPVAMTLKKSGMDGDRHVRPVLKSSKREAKAEAKSATLGNKTGDQGKKNGDTGTRTGDPFVTGPKTGTSSAANNRNFAIVGAPDPRKTRTSEPKAKAGSSAEPKSKSSAAKSPHKSAGKSSETKSKKKTTKHKKSEPSSK